MITKCEKQILSITAAFVFAALISALVVLLVKLVLVTQSFLILVGGGK